MDVLILGSSNLPSVILCVEQEVGADDGDADSDDGQDHKDQEHEAVHVVDLVSPERGEDEIPVLKNHIKNCYHLFNMHGTKITFR